MAEIVGLAASIIQIAGAGTKLSVTLYNFVGSAARADQEIGDIAEDVGMTANALDSVAKVFEDANAKSVVSKKAVQDAENLIKRCENVFGEINEVINKRRKIRGGDGKKEGKMGLSMVGKFAWPMKEQRIELLRRRLESLKNSLILLLHVLQLATAQANGKIEKSALELERETIRSLHQRQQESLKCLQALESRFSNVTLDDEETLSGSVAPSRVPTVDFMACSSVPEQLKQAGVEEPVKAKPTKASDKLEILTDDSEISESDATATDGEEDPLTVEDLAKCARHVQKLLKRISTLQESFETAQTKRKMPRHRIHKLYRRFCDKFESELPLATKKSASEALTLPHFGTLFKSGEQGPRKMTSNSDSLILLNPEQQKYVIPNSASAVDTDIPPSIVQSHHHHHLPTPAHHLKDQKQNVSPQNSTFVDYNRFAGYNDAPSLPRQRNVSHLCVVGLEGMPLPAPRPRGPKLQFTPEDDELLINLKENKNLTWKQIADFFPGRSSGTMQVRYCTKLKKPLPKKEFGRDESLPVPSSSGQNERNRQRDKEPYVPQSPPPVPIHKLRNRGTDLTATGDFSCSFASIEQQSRSSEKLHHTTPFLSHMDQLEEGNDAHADMEENQDSSAQNLSKEVEELTKLITANNPRLHGDGECVDRREQDDRHNALRKRRADLLFKMRDGLRERQAKHARHSDESHPPGSERKPSLSGYLGPGPEDVPQSIGNVQPPEKTHQNLPLSFAYDSRHGTLKDFDFDSFLHANDDLVQHESFAFHSVDPKSAHVQSTDTGVPISRSNPSIGYGPSNLFGGIMSGSSSRVPGLAHPPQEPEQSNSIENSYSPGTRPRIHTSSSIEVGPLKPREVDQERQQWAMPGPHKGTFYDYENGEPEQELAQQQAVGTASIQDGKDISTTAEQAMARARAEQQVLAQRMAQQQAHAQRQMFQQQMPQSQMMMNQRNTAMPMLNMPMNPQIQRAYQQQRPVASNLQLPPRNMQTFTAHNHVQLADERGRRATDQGQLLTEEIRSKLIPLDMLHVPSVKQAFMDMTDSEFRSTLSTTKLHSQRNAQWPPDTQRPQQAQQHMQQQQPQQIQAQAQAQNQAPEVNSHAQQLQDYQMSLLTNRNCRQPKRGKIMYRSRDVPKQATDSSANAPDDKIPMLMGYDPNSTLICGERKDRKKMYRAGDVPEVATGSIATAYSVEAPTEPMGVKIQHPNVMLPHQLPQAQNLEAEEPPLFVNAKQFSRIVKRREQRAYLEQRIREGAFAESSSDGDEEGDEDSANDESIDEEWTPKSTSAKISNELLTSPVQYPKAQQYQPQQQDTSVNIPWQEYQEQVQEVLGLDPRFPSRIVRPSHPQPQLPIQDQEQSQHQKLQPLYTNTTLDDYKAGIGSYTQKSQDTQPPSTQIFTEPPPQSPNLVNMDTVNKIPGTAQAQQSTRNSPELQPPHCEESVHNPILSHPFMMDLPSGDKYRGTPSYYDYVQGSPPAGQSHFFSGFQVSQSTAAGPTATHQSVLFSSGASRKRSRADDGMDFVGQVPVMAFPRQPADEALQLENTNLPAYENLAPEEQKRACEACRRAMIRCDKKDPACGKCQRDGRWCEYMEIRKRKSRKEHSTDLDSTLSWEEFLSRHSNDKTGARIPITFSRLNRMEETASSALSTDGGIHDTIDSNLPSTATGALTAVDRDHINSPVPEEQNRQRSHGTKTFRQRLQTASLEKKQRQAETPDTIEEANHSKNILPESPHTLSALRNNAVKGYGRQETRQLTPPSMFVDVSNPTDFKRNRAAGSSSRFRLAREEKARRQNARILQLETALRDHNIDLPSDAPASSPNDPQVPISPYSADGNAISANTTSNLEPHKSNEQESEPTVTPPSSDMPQDASAALLKSPERDPGRQELPGVPHAQALDSVNKITMDVKHNSRMGASARFRAARKEKERQFYTRIHQLETALRQHSIDIPDEPASPPSEPTVSSHSADKDPLSTITFSTPLPQTSTQQAPEQPNTLQPPEKPSDLLGSPEKETRRQVLPPGFSIDWYDTIKYPMDEKRKRNASAEARFRVRSAEQARQALEPDLASSNSLWATCVQCRSQNLECDGNIHCSRCKDSSLECTYVIIGHGWEGKEKMASEDGSVYSDYSETPLLIGSRQDHQLASASTLRKTKKMSRAESIEPELVRATVLPRATSPVMPLVQQVNTPREESVAAQNNSRPKQSFEQLPFFISPSHSVRDPNSGYSIIWYTESQLRTFYERNSHLPPQPYHVLSLDQLETPMLPGLPFDNLVSSGTWQCDHPNCVSKPEFFYLCDLRQHQNMTHGRLPPQFGCVEPACTRVGDWGFEKWEKMAGHICEVHGSVKTFNPLFMNSNEGSHVRGMALEHGGKPPNRCLQCRNQKLRCDGRVQCSKCKDSGVECTYAAIATQQAQAEADSSRMRLTQSEKRSRGRVADETKLENTETHSRRDETQKQQDTESHNLRSTGSLAESWAEVRSLSNSGNGWAEVDMGGFGQALDLTKDPNTLILNPSQALHIRTTSDSGSPKIHVPVTPALLMRLSSPTSDMSHRNLGKQPPALSIIPQLLEKPTSPFSTTNDGDTFRSGKPKLHSKQLMPNIDGSGAASTPQTPEVPTLNNEGDGSQKAVPFSGLTSLVSSKRPKRRSAAPPIGEEFDIDEPQPTPPPPTAPKIREFFGEISQPKPGSMTPSPDNKRKRANRPGNPSMDDLESRESDRKRTKTAMPVSTRPPLSFGAGPIGAPSYSISGSASVPKIDRGNDEDDNQDKDKNQDKNQDKDKNQDEDVTQDKNKNPNWTLDTDMDSMDVTRARDMYGMDMYMDLGLSDDEEGLMPWINEFLVDRSSPETLGRTSQVSTSSGDGGEKDRCGEEDEREEEEGEKQQEDKEDERDIVDILLADWTTLPI